MKTIFTLLLIGIAFFLNAQNVGIGTEDPDGKLTVEAVSTDSAIIARASLLEGTGISAFGDVAGDFNAGTTGINSIGVRSYGALGADIHGFNQGLKVGGHYIGAEFMSTSPGSNAIAANSPSGTGVYATGEYGGEFSGVSTGITSRGFVGGSFEGNDFVSNGSGIVATGSKGGNFLGTEIGIVVEGELGGGQFTSHSVLSNAIEGWSNDGTGVYGTGVYGGEFHGSTRGVSGFSHTGGYFEGDEENGTGVYAYGSLGGNFDGLNIGIEVEGESIAGNFVANGINGTGIETEGHIGLHSTGGLYSARLFGDVRIDGETSQTGNLGIGISNPATPLHIKSANQSGATIMATLEANNSDRPVLLFSETDSESTLSSGMSIEYNGAGNSSENRLNFNRVGGTAAMSIRSLSGNVGIGTVSPSEKLEVIGTIKANDYMTSSDLRYKKDLSKIASATEKVGQLNGYYYFLRTNEFPEKEFDSGRQVGLIAQEVEAVIPEAVKKDVEGYRSVDYGKMVAVLIEAVKEQQSEIQLLKKELATLKMDSPVSNDSKSEAESKDIHGIGSH